MVTEVAIAFLLGGLVGLDTTAAWQIMLSHPLVACPLVGVLVGEPELGLFFGIAFELIWLYDLPMGGAKFPEGNIGSLVGFMVARSLIEKSAEAEPWIILFSCIFAMIAAYFVGGAVVYLRKSNVRLVARADQYAEAGEVGHVERAHLTGVVRTFLWSASLTLALFYAGHVLIGWLIAVLQMTAPFTAFQIQIVFIGIGLAVMLQLFFRRKVWWYFLASVAGGILIYLMV